MKNPIGILSIGFLLLISSGSIFSQYTTEPFDFVEVYPGPEGISASDHFLVNIHQENKSHESFVYKNENDDPDDEHLKRELFAGIESNPALMKYYYGVDGPEWDEAEKYQGIGAGLERDPKIDREKVRMREQSASYTTFSFRGEIEVEVVKPGAMVESVKIMPSSKEIVAELSNGKARFKLNRPEKLVVIINNDYLNPLFLFADGPEMAAPDKSLPGVLTIKPGDDYEVKKEEAGQALVVYFEPGVHEIGMAFSVFPNQTIYIEGGAYLKGTLHAFMANNVTIRGRGIISGEIFSRKMILDLKRERGTEAMIERLKLMGINMLSHDNMQDWNTYTKHAGNGCDNLLIEGVTIVDPGHFFMRITGYPITVHNVKMVGGWHHNNDGISAIGQPSTTVFDCFFHCNDDGIYIRFDDLHIHDCIFWQNTNGSVFQFAWGGDPYDVGGGLIHDCDIIHTGHAHENNNRTIIGSRKSGQKDISDVTFKNIRVEGPVWRMFRINTYYRGRNPEETGSIHHIKFENITINGPVINKNEIIAQEHKPDNVPYANSSVHDITFKNVVVNGKPLSRDDFIFGEENVYNIVIEE